MHLLVILVIFVPFSICQDSKKSQLRKRLSGNYDINQYANDAGGGVSGVAEDGNLDDANEIDGGDGGGERVASLFETIPGEPKRDYPTYRRIPKTGFTCKGRVNWGYYADVETECQVFHVCESQYSKISFLCPLGSAFNQKHLVCDWWYNFDCHEEISLTSLYDDYEIGVLSQEPEPEVVVGPGSGQHRRQGDNRDNRSTLRIGSTKTRDYRYEDEDYANDDLNLVSSGGNI